MGAQALPALEAIAKCAGYAANQSGHLAYISRPPRSLGDGYDLERLLAGRFRRGR
jgi:hypothetical protein